MTSRLTTRALSFTFAVLMTLGMLGTVNHLARFEAETAIDAAMTAQSVAPSATHA